MDRAWNAALLQLAQHVYASHAELADAMLSMLWDMFSSWRLNQESKAPSDKQGESMTGAAFTLLPKCCFLIFLSLVFLHPAFLPCLTSPSSLFFSLHPSAHRQLYNM